MEGKCHQCKKWVFVESIKNMDIKVSHHRHSGHLTEHVVGERTLLVRAKRGRRNTRQLSCIGGNTPLHATKARI